jgi:hypothetical protein
MRHPPHPSSLDARVRAAWQAQVAAAFQTPGLLPELMRRRHELLPRFAAYYTQLRALPRRVRRALQRQWRLPLAGMALMLALGQSPGLAATIPVGNACTLVDAITAANTDTATGGCPAGSGADTIVLPADSTQTLTSVNNDTYGATGLPVIRSVITIEGRGGTITRDSGAPEFRLLAVNGMGDLTLQETTMSGGATPPGSRGAGIVNDGGTLTVLNSTIAGNSISSYGNGGGIANNGGTLTVLNSSIAANSSGSAGGGGVWNYNGTITVRNSTITGNSAFAGGGIGNNGILTVRNSTITGNSASSLSFGGGMSNERYNAVEHNALTVLDSTITGNKGAGIWNGFTGILTIRNSTLADNSAVAGGGLQNLGTGTVLNSTITGNSAIYNGGGVANIFGTLTVLNSTITGNVATGAAYVSTRGGGVANFNSDARLTLARTLVAGNTAVTGREIDNSYGGTVVVDSHNLFGVDGTAGVSGFSPSRTDVVPPAGVQLPDILEPTMALHGGRTQTHALVPGSPAIDAAGPVCLDDDGDPLPTDQRGRPRPVDGDGAGVAACDIGAFEFFPVANDFVTLDPALETASDPTPVPGGPAGTFTITATFTHTSETPLRVPFFEVTALSGGNLLLNGDEGARGVAATLTPEVGDRVLSPGETVIVDFVIGLQVRAPFTFVVELFGEPL